MNHSTYEFAALPSVREIIMGKIKTFAPVRQVAQTPVQNRARPRMLNSIHSSKSQTRNFSSRSSMSFISKQV